MSDTPTPGNAANNANQPDEPVAQSFGGRRGGGSRRHRRPTVEENAAASANLPRRRLAMLRPGMVLPGVLKRLVKGGALADILLESGELAFIPLSEIPAKAMPKVREMVAQGTLQEIRLVQLDRASGTATGSLRGLIEGIEEEESRKLARQVPPPPDLPAPSKVTTPAPAKTSASERARRQQEEILRRMRGEA